jgi:lipoprotein-anchoring transpeptidase ErfK/SrfK
VVAGDTMAKIVAPVGITAELAARINQISNPQIVRLNATLKLIRGPFNAVIDKSDHRMDIYLGDIYVRSFNVGLGADAGTPTGLWAVRNKLMNPEWIDPATGHRYLADAPDNPIGERWIGLMGLTGDAVGRSGFGIHGTIDADSIGRNQSMGCIRLVADDVAWVYDLLVDGKSRVAVRE